MRLIYLLFTILFTLPSTVVWRGIAIDFSQCGMITEFFNVPGSNWLLHPAKIPVKNFFSAFKLPSTSVKGKKYVLKLFNLNLDISMLSSTGLTNLFIDRNALGLPKKYLDPLLLECIKRKFCTENSPNGFIHPVTLTQSRIFRDIRFSCFEYLKENMTSNLPLFDIYFSTIFNHDSNAIQSFPEWNEMLRDSDKATTFFITLSRVAGLRNLYLNGLRPDVLTTFFHNMNKFRNNIYVEISNAQIECPLGFLKLLTEHKKIHFQNCHNLSLGSNKKARIICADNDVFWLFNEYNQSPFSFQNCSLEQESLKKCKAIGHRRSMVMILPLSISLSCAYLFFGVLLSDSLFVRGLCFSLLSYCLILFRINENFGFSYLSVLMAIQIAHFVIPYLLKDSFVSACQLCSLILMTAVFVIGYCIHYDIVRRNMRRLMKNDFGIITEYAFLDKLCRKIF